MFYDKYRFTNFRNLYDIYSTPVIYILDKNKKNYCKNEIGNGGRLRNFIEFERSKEKKIMVKKNPSIFRSISIFAGSVSFSQGYRIENTKLHPLSKY